MENVKIITKYPGSLRFFVELMQGFSTIIVFVACFHIVSSITNLFGGIFISALLLVIWLNLPAPIIKGE